MSAVVSRALGSLLLASAGVLAGCLDVPHLDASTSGEPVCDPCRAFLDDGPARAVEASITVDASDPSHIIVVSLRARPNATSTVGVPAVHITWDAGKTWHDGELAFGRALTGPTNPVAATTAAVRNPTALALRDGTVLVAGAGTTLLSATGVAPAYYHSEVWLRVARSEDGGRTFPDIVTVDVGRGHSVGTPLDELKAFSQSSYHPRLAEGPDGTVLLTWMHKNVTGVRGGIRADERIEVRFAVSTDGGRSWTSPRALVGADTGPLGLIYGGSPLVAPSGDFLVAFASPSDREDEAVVLGFARSHDRGAAWETRELGTTIGVPALASPSGDGRDLALAFTVQDGDLRLPALLRSSDGGATWSPPVVLDRPEGKGLPLPALAADGAGRLYASFYHSRADGAAEFRVLRFPDPEPLLLDGGSEALPSSSRDYGDYTGLAGTPDGIVAAWPTGAHANSDLAWGAVRHRDSRGPAP